MAGQLKVNGVTLATESSGTVTLENPQIKDSSNNVILDQSGTNPVLKNVEVVNNSSMMFRNRIINGDMRIDQRNGGASVTPTSGQYLVDRFYYQSTQSSKFTAQQNAGGVTPPTGFTKYQGLTSSSSYAVTSSDYFIIRQPIEGFNVADLAWGTASAATVTLSFWVHSSLAGTFGGSLTNTGARWYPFSYTISAANTWEYKTIVIAGDTTGTWATDNTAGIQISWALGVGSSFSGTAGAWTGSTIIAPTGATSVVGTSGATFYITGVQLEKGTVATQFEHRPYGTELALCQRYFQVLEYKSSWGAAGFGMIRNNTGSVITSITLIQEMRIAPHTITLPTIGQGSGNITFLNGEGYPATHGSLEATEVTKTDIKLFFQNFSSLGSQGQVSWAYVTAPSAIFKFDSEL